MSVLASLTHAYERMAARGEVPPFGYSNEKIGFVIALNSDGAPAGKPADLREQNGKKLLPRIMAVPRPGKRTSGVASNFLWDKTSYVLGVSAGDDKRLADKHQAFVARHENALANNDDEGLRALLQFLHQWTPENFAALGWPEEMKDQNVVFALESERMDNMFLHDRPAARQVWTDISADDEGPRAVCLVTGRHAPIARLHPAIKGVWGAQSSGASLVSFNLDAFESYGHTQGDNAPVSEAAAFAYVAALNSFLAGKRNRIQIGDASTVFWSDAGDPAATEVAESSFLAFLDPVDEKTEDAKLVTILEKIRKGERLKDFDPGLADSVRFYVLGLAPNAARISVRFWLESDFGTLSQRYQRFLDDTKIEPAPRERYPALWRYLRATAVLGKGENVPPNLAGEWMRAILSGTNYPLTLLSGTLMRLRSDKDVNVHRVAILRAVLVRNFKMENTPVALDLENRDRGYLLGRLFAIYERIQSEALGGNVNATVKDKFYGSASAQPRKVFALLEKSSANHLAKLGKQKPGHRVQMEKEVAAIMDVMSPSHDPFPSALSAQEQALFGLGYYHQRSEFFKPRKPATHEEMAQ